MAGPPLSGGLLGTGHTAPKVASPVLLKSTVAAARFLGRGGGAGPTSKQVTASRCRGGGRAWRPRLRLVFHTPYHMVWRSHRRQLAPTLCRLLALDGLRSVLLQISPQWFLGTQPLLLSRPPWFFVLCSMYPPCVPVASCR